MVNSYSSWWRRRGRWEVTGVVGSDYARPESISPPADAGLVDRDALWRALAGLPRQQRAVLVLRYYEDLSERDIAAILGVSTGTVKSQASRALRRLAEVVGGDFELPAGSPFPRQENPR
jgi:RNA polymerase sigma factor (sigma-70 family)